MTTAVDQRLRSSARRAWAHRAADLYDFHAGEQWRDAGHETFESWIAASGLDRHTVYDSLLIWRELVIERSVAPQWLEDLVFSRVRVVARAIVAGRTDVAALGDCEHLSRDELEARYGASVTPREAKGAGSNEQAGPCSRSLVARGVRPGVSPALEAMHPEVG